MTEGTRLPGRTRPVGACVSGLLRDPWLLAIVISNVVLGVYHLDWGLPNGNHSWAADALGPLTVLSIARRSVTSWNSGWFYFKYPLGYPLLLVAAVTPYLALLFVSGDFRAPNPVYPYGFSQPETAVYVMALCGRLASVGCNAVTVLLTYAIGRRLAGRTAGLFAAWFIATAYPVIYYAHTTNLDAAYLLWLTLALWGAVVACEEQRPWPYVVLGSAAAMAVSTKEQAFAMLLALPVLIVVQRWREPALAALSGWKRCGAVVWNSGTRAGLAAAVVVFAFANNVLLNPSGLVNRVRYLAGASVPGVTARLAPVEFSPFKGFAKEWLYAKQLADAMDSTLGTPLFVLAVAGLVYLIARSRRAAFVLLVPAVTHYYVSLRALDLITLRYTLPLGVLAAIAAGALCARSLAWRARPVAIVAASALCAFGLARAVEVDLLLRLDPRYDAERWLQAHAPAGATVEIYQKRTYLPRLDGLSAEEVPLGRRTISGIEERRPEFVILSSAGRQNIAHRWAHDWRETGSLLVREPEAARLLEALESGTLAYAPAARFSRQPVLIRSRITSLCPEISIYRRVKP